MRGKLRLECVAAFGVLQLVVIYLVLYLTWKPPGVDSQPEKRLLLSIRDTSSQSLNDESQIRVNDISSFEGQIDKWRMMKSHMFVATGTEWNQLSESRKTCLATQTSVDRLYWVLNTTSTWSGPISVAVFTPDIEYDIAKRYINFMRTCFPNVLHQVSFHFVYPVTHPLKTSEEITLQIGTNSIECEQSPLDVLKLLLQFQTEDFKEWRIPTEYPQNLMRNIAKSGCQTEYTFVPDVDMIPNEGMDLMLQTFLSQKPVCEKCAFVVPVYEILSSAIPMPRNKSELQQFVKKGQARQFHKAIYDLNQRSSNLSYWEKLPQGPTLEVSYNVSKYIFKYEPLYVAKATIPTFDERFIGFGMTRNTQVYEMFVAGYQFMMLNNAFANHWGFQSLKSRPEFRAKQQEKNNARFDEFAREVSARYGRDPYQMLGKLKKMNLKNAKVSYNKAAGTKSPG